MKARIDKAVTCDRWCACRNSYINDKLSSSTMAAGAWTLTNVGRTRLLDGTLYLDTDLFKFKIALHLEVYMRATTGTVYGRLIDSANNVVTNSEVSTASTTFQRLRSSALTLVNGETYRDQFGKAGGDAGEFLEARIIMIPA